MSQQRLLQKNFGLDANVIVTGMNSDFDVLTHHEQSNHLRKKTVVFHANPLAAKGVDWTIELAKQLPDFEFIFPFDRNDLPEFLIPKNCSFASMSWETGLKELISESEYVICPSLWSAPIEGALIKSIVFGNKVLVVDEISAFQNDLKSIADLNLIRLPQSVSDSAEILQRDSSGLGKMDTSKRTLLSEMVGGESVVNAVYNAMEP